MQNRRINNKISILQLILLCSVASPVLLKAQNSYSFFESFEKYRPDTTGRFFIAVDNFNFFRNNEYKSPVVEGYTLTGAWLRPKAVFYPDRKLRLELGGNILKYNGRDDYHHPTPWFSAIYFPTPELSVTLGNLNNDHLRGLIEPLIDPESFITGKPESGLQVKYDHRWIEADLWIDWQKMILTGDPFQEKFQFGASTRISLLNKDKNEIFLPVSFTGQHLGGEIDQSEAPVKTFAAISGGIAAQHSTGSARISDFGGSLHFVLSTYPEELLLPSKSGNGIYLRTWLNSRLGQLSASYWNSKEFFTPLGNPLYQNASAMTDQISEKNGLIDLQYRLDQKIFGASHFGFVFDYYWDHIRQKSSNSAGLFLIVNLEMLICKKQANPDRGTKNF